MEVSELNLNAERPKVLIDTKRARIDHKLLAFTRKLTTLD
jgi:hypothetical protein